MSVPQGQREAEQHTQQGAGSTVPLTASEIDNLSSVSNTSTVLTDLSLRLEKIEDMLSRLLEAHKNEGRFSEKEDVVALRPGSRPSQTGEGSGGSQGNNANRPSARDLPGERWTDQNSHLSALALHDTAEQLREARGQLQLLEAAGATGLTSLSTATDSGQQPTKISANASGANRLGPLGSIPPNSTLDTKLVGGKSAELMVQSTGGEGISKGDKKDEGVLGDQEMEVERRVTMTEEGKNDEQKREAGTWGEENQLANASSTDRLTTISESPAL